MAANPPVWDTTTGTQARWRGAACVEREEVARWRLELELAAACKLEPFRASQVAGGRTSIRARGGGVPRVSCVGVPGGLGRDRVKCRQFAKPSDLNLDE